LKKKRKKERYSTRARSKDASRAQAHKKMAERRKNRKRKDVSVAYGRGSRRVSYGTWLANVRRDRS